MLEIGNIKIPFSRMGVLIGKTTTETLESMGYRVCATGKSDFQSMIKYIDKINCHKVSNYIKSQVDKGILFGSLSENEIRLALIQANSVKAAFASIEDVIKIPIHFSERKLAFNPVFSSFSTLYI